MIYNPKHMRVDKNRLFYLLACAVIILASCVILDHLIQPPRKTSSSTLGVSVASSYTIKIDFGNDKPTEINTPVPQPATAYSALVNAALAKQLTLDTTQYDFGIFVKSINGFVSSASKSWIYYVNGQSGQVAADKYNLKPGDVVEWKYVKPQL